MVLIGDRRPVLLATLVMVACAPPATFWPAARPAADGRRTEVGVGGAAVLPRPYVNEPTYGAGLVWGARALTPRWAISGLAAFDRDSLAAGAAVRLTALRSSRLAAGATFELGHAWAGLALPAALRLGGEAWLYTAPRIGNWGDRLAPGLPMGLSVPIAGGVDLRGEAQVSWADFDPNNRRIHLGLAAAYRFGASPGPAVPR